MNEVVCQCEVYQTCSECRGTDRDMSLALQQEPELSVGELLERSTLYHQLISDLGDIFDVSISSTQRSRAFQVVSDFVEQLEARK